MIMYLLEIIRVASETWEVRNEGKRLFTGSHQEAHSFARTYSPELDMHVR